MVASGDQIVTPHLRLQWGGALGTPDVEIWSNTMRFLGGGVVPTAAQLQQVATACAVPLTAWFTDTRNGNVNPASLIGTAASLRYLKAVWLLDNGLQRDQETATNFFPATVFGKTGGSPIWEQTYAITLRTAASRGRAHAGRFFPPVSGGTSVDVATGYVGVVSANGMANAAAALIREMQVAINATLAATGAGFQAGVISPGSREKGTQEVSRVYNRVTCDRVPDIQHRRTNRMIRSESTYYPTTPQ